jgi:ribulose-5-phosphate 4-epimerase/fuculose-1-phosphate aldolase
MPHATPNTETPDTGTPNTGTNEWRVRCDLAALYRLAALEGWDDLIFTHISARLPGADHHFLLNPYGLRFSEITASSLVKIDAAGQPVEAGDQRVNHAGFVIHSAIHRARPEAQFILHFHTDDGMAVSSQREGLLPLNQRALEVLPILAYHDFEGIAEDLAECERIIADFGRAKVMFLRNHGTLAVGATPGEAWLNIFNLERACTVQVRALSGGRDSLLLPSPAVQAEVAAQTAGLDGRQSYADRVTTDLVWTAELRRLGRLSPGYDV